MTGWRACLSTLRAQGDDADSRLAELRARTGCLPNDTNGANSIGISSAPGRGASTEQPANGANGPFGSGVFSDEEVGAARAAAFHAEVAEATAVLAMPDPDLAHERAEIAAALAAEERGDHGEPAPEADHSISVAGLLASARRRPPSWSDPASPPLPGAWCSCCGRKRKAGGRWWCEAEAPRGWRCATCYPPNPGAAVVEVRT